MARTRVIVGAIGGDSQGRAAARELRDQGHEVIYVGGDQTPEQLVSTAVAEDASRIVVLGDPADLLAVTDLCGQLGAYDVSVSGWV